MLLCKQTFISQLFTILLLILCIAAKPFRSKNEAATYWHTLSFSGQSRDHVRLWQAMVILGTSTPENQTPAQLYLDSIKNANMYRKIMSVTSNVHYPFVERALKVVMKAVMKEKTLPVE